MGKTCGDDLVSYMIMQDVTKLDQVSLTAEQKAVIAKLTDLARQTVDLPAAQQRAVVRSELLTYESEKSTTFANAARLSCGGRLPDVGTIDDGALHSLLIMGRDVYPALLVPPIADYAR